MSPNHTSTEEQSAARTAEAAALMSRYAEDTGLGSARPPRRYLWTDAFALCNCISLSRATGEPRWAELGERLVDQVHEVLGKHRPDDTRQGWLSGLDQQAGAAHPTLGGLRIGKPLPERRADQPFDPDLEWERDGQYFHYLTKWMHALDQWSRFTGEPRFNLWARELAQSAYRGFGRGEADVDHDDGPGPLVWKMSIDLRRPLVTSTGQHDALDGFITCDQLRVTAGVLPGAPGEPTLEEELDALADLKQEGDWLTTDPLGLGGLLLEGARALQLHQRGSSCEADLIIRMLTAALRGLGHYARTGELRRPAERRLAFRELGLAIGLRAVDLVAAEPAPALDAVDLRARLTAVRSYDPLADSIEAFWVEPDNQMVSSWIDHRHINEVMLATSLLPRGAALL